MLPQSHTVYSMVVCSMKRANGCSLWLPLLHPYRKHWSFIYFVYSELFECLCTRCAASVFSLSRSISHQLVDLVFGALYTKHAVFRLLTHQTSPLEPNQSSRFARTTRPPESGTKSSWINIVEASHRVHLVTIWHSPEYKRFWLRMHQKIKKLRKFNKLKQQNQPFRTRTQSKQSNPKC